jgi:hypothetical protein
MGGLLDCVSGGGVNRVRVSWDRVVQGRLHALYEILVAHCDLFSGHRIKCTLKQVGSLSRSRSPLAPCSCVILRQHISCQHSSPHRLLHHASSDPSGVYLCDFYTLHTHARTHIRTTIYTKWRWSGDISTVYITHLALY